MNATVTIDTTGLNERLRALDEALLAYGDDTDLRKMMRDQAGILAKEISVKLGPRTQAIGETRLGKAVKNAFTEIDVPVFPQAQRGGKKGPLQFLFATRKMSGQLIGVQSNDLVLSTLTADQLIKQSRRPRGIKWEKVGYRGGKKANQMVVRLNRYVVQKGRMKEMLGLLKHRIGRLRATFAYAAAALGRKDIPAWVSRHFADVRSDGRALFDMAKLKDKDNPVIEFGSRAPGIENFEEIVQTAVDNRARKVADRCAGILKAINRRDRSGYQPEP